MAKVIKIGIVPYKGGKINTVNSIEVVKGKGIVGDRTFKENNHIKSQITLIEIENINDYNKIAKTNISSIDFRRNIVTENIKLNDLVGCEFYIGKIEIKESNKEKKVDFFSDFSQLRFVKIMSFEKDIN